ncbi:hypothetical protein PIIN_11719 [Serendipita indica DSM 11827]|uniref:YPC1-Alkaline Ceramidase n=1 Tax=Serendipita indica (strain DSM 11827) TaxID=1109443 RepID=G4T6H2_SERID|nr:hypothetical protein PIIN_11719 [Serendipita indica DSM 11827]
MDIKPFHRPGQVAHGLFGEHTSTLDWCEDNYVHFMFIAETWNSLSNIPFVLLAAHGMMKTLRENLPNQKRYAFCHAMIAFIGLGSFAFHATLLWHAQVLLDELPMIYASFQAIYCILLEGRPSSSLSPKIICTVLPALFTALYIAYPNPIFHQVVYGALQLFITYRMQAILKRFPPDSKLKKDCTHLLKTGTVLTLLAFTIWNMDNLLCEDITAWRESVGSLGVLSQGHAWWHLLVACGSNRFVVAMIGLMSGLKEPDSYEVAYNLYAFPYLRRKEGETAKAK